jgi:hypothetical protein
MFGGGGQTGGGGWRRGHEYAAEQAAGDIRLIGAGDMDERHGFSSIN